MDACESTDTAVLKTSSPDSDILEADGPASPHASRRTGSARALRAVTLACIFILVLLAVVGSALSVGDRLADANAVLGVLFYGTVAALLVAGVVVPLVGVLARPVFSLYRLRDAKGRAKRHWCRLLVRNMTSVSTVTAAEKATLHMYLEAGDEADDLLIAFFKEKFEPAMDLETKRCAKTAFFATAVSQSALVDAATMLSLSFNLVRSIVECCGYRPSNAALVKLYAHVMFGALVAGGLEDADLDALFAGLLGGSGAAHVSGAVLAGATQGVVNAFLIYRIGVMTKRHLCAADGPTSIADLRAASYREALSLMRSSGFLSEVFAAVRERASRAASSAATVAKNAAVQVGKTACESVASAVSNATDAVKTGLFAHRSIRGGTKDKG